MLTVVDSQVHIWGADTPLRPWPISEAKPHRPGDFLVSELIQEMDIAKVDRAILVPPMWEGDRNDLVIEAANTYPKRFAIMGRINLFDESAQFKLNNWRNNSMLGLRLVFKRNPYRAIFESNSLEWFWEDCQKLNLPLMVLIDTMQIKRIEEIAKTYPYLKLTLDHLCLATGSKDEDVYRQIEYVLPLAKYSNISVKLTSITNFTNSPFPFTKIHPLIHQVYKSFGPTRIFWGSDLTHLTCSYSEALRLFTEEISWLSSSDKEWILGRGISEWLRW